MKKADVLQPVGRILRSQGAGGELKFKLFPDFSLERVSSLFLRHGDRTERFDVEAVRCERGSSYIKLRGIDGLKEAETLRGYEILISAERLAPAGENAYFAGQLIGCRVSTLSGEDLGVVREVVPVGESGLLVVKREGRETIIPLAADICREIRPEEGMIRVDPPDGLLDLNEI
ncbi:MAG: 16S rRNA processing protein RimM [Candidatus Aminicenantes bacterium RBG_13_62_12]|nr:MAG: 16S rRNA processing protein RimM [Candidatus Aminicenantes bacterium RBG_13_62_12]